MGSARTMTVEAFIDNLNYHLRDTDIQQWGDTETLIYINQWYEFIYQMLAEHESDLVMTGSGSFTTVAGTERYALADNSMGDLWTIPGCDDAAESNVRISGYAGLELVARQERLTYLLAEDDSSTTSRNKPTMFYLHGGEIGLLPFPDAAYTVYIEDYIPNWEPITDSSNMPFQNLFNLVLMEGAKISAKNREGDGSAVDAALIELFQDRVVSVLRQRQKQNQRLTL